ncbi:MAG: gamma-glutamyltransferase family protein [Rhodospirillaceae bacterium]|nr:gamma-glutamyltransferase family protein [Rhodospirillaceae bacterium]
MDAARPEIRGTFGAVGSTHWVASHVGMAMMERGGNAADAAVAAGFALQVVEPHQNGPAGDVPIIVQDATGEARVICGQGPAPKAATIAAYRALGVELIPGTGLLAAVVPGAFDAWMILLRDHGRMSLREVLEPAVAYARDGFPVSFTLSLYIDAVRGLLAETWPESGKIYLRNGQAPAPGTLLRNVQLAKTYARVIDEAEAAGGGREAQIEAARDAYYQGFIAEAIGRFGETEVPDGAGRSDRAFLTADDLAGWRAPVEAPATIDYHGYTVIKTGPWGQGPVALQTLSILEGFDLGSMDPNGPEFVHVLTEAMKLTMADREAYYGDPDFVDVPLTALLDPTYGAARRAQIGRAASTELRPGQIGDTPPVLPRIVREGSRIAAPMAPGGGEPNATLAREMAGDTANVNTVDQDGNMVSAMPSGGWLQSSPVMPELGFCLGTRAQMFWLEDGLPASLAPGRRPRTTLTPGLCLRDGKPYMAFGSPGGDSQDQWALQLFLRHVHHGMDLQESIDAPAFQSDHAPSSFYPRDARPNHLQVESRYGRETITELKRLGHEVEDVGPWTLGRLSAVAKDGDVIRAGASQRNRSGCAAGR